MIGSEAYFDSLIDLGAKFMWLFTYMPVGVDAVPELMASSEQREYMYHFVRAMRDKKPLFTMDFWNDGEYADGCIAGGRRYLHINANGDVEPCAFIHYSDSNIREKACWRRCSLRYSWPITGDSPLMRICSAPARCWTIRGNWRKW